jgi:hypothetical protein
VDTHKQVASLSDKMIKILSASARLRDMEGVDMTAKVELYEELIEAYSGAQDLSVSWCTSKASFHLSQGNHTEAGAAFTKAACMIAGQLEQAKLVPGGTRDSLLHVIPWYAPKGVKQDHQGKEAVESDRRAMISHIEQAASAYKDGGCFETAVLAYQVLTHVYGNSLEYPKLALLHGNIRSMYQLAIAAESGEARMLGTYFRVGFYGSEFGSLSGQQYIYKHPKITQIVEVKEAMVAMWMRRLADVVVSVISTSHPVDARSLDGPHLQITKVDPDIDGEVRLTHFQKNTDIRSFSFESPFTLDGKGQAAIDVQWVRRTVLTVATPFPCTRLRQMVVSSDSTEAAPIANAIDIVKQIGRASCRERVY